VKANVKVTNVLFKKVIGSEAWATIFWLNSRAKGREKHDVAHSLDLTDFPVIATAAGVLKVMAEVTRRVTNGQLSIGDAQALLALLERQRKTLETADLLHQMSELK
jgi:hypothetical protein